MSEFLTDLDIKLRSDSDKIYILKSELIYLSDTLGKIIIPEGFQTDFASVPRVPFIYEAWGDRAHREAVLHDYLYRKDSKPYVTFMDANRAFLEAMESRDKPIHIRYPMFWGVVIGGYPSYHKKYVGDEL